MADDPETARGAKLIANAYVVRAGKKPRWGTPNPTWRKTQFIQAAITAECPNGPLSDELNESKLTRDVNTRLQSDPTFSAFRKKYGSAEVSRQAVMTALQMLREANR